MPKEIYYRCIKYTYDDYTTDYKRDIGTNLFTYLFSKERTTCFINDEVEIIEEDKKIEKIIPTSLKGIDNLDEKIEVSHIDTISAIDKINEIIDKLNEGE